MASSAVLDILREIKNNNLKSALVKLQALSCSKKKEKLTLAHYSVLKQLNEHVYFKKDKNEKIQDEEDVYNLAVTCCSYLSQKWDCKIIPFMQCTYHIQKYLIHKYPFLSKDICEYYFKLKNDLKIQNWGDKEKLVLLNVYQDFSSRLFNSITKDSDIFGTDDKSLQSWILYLFKLLKLQNYSNIYRIFDSLSVISSAIIINHGKDACVKFGQLSFIQLSNFLNEIVKFDGKDFEKFLHFMEYSTYYSNQDSYLKFFESILKCIQSIDKIYPGSKFLPIETCIKLCSETDEKKCEILLIDLLDSIKKSECAYIYKLVSNMLMQFQSFFISESPVVRTNFPLIIRLCRILCGQLAKDISSRKSPYFFSNVIHLPSFFIMNLNTKDDEFKKTLIRINPELKKLYSILMCDNIEKYISSDCITVLNAAIAYKNSELYKECAPLCEILLMFLLKIKPQDINNKTFLYTLSIFPSVYNEIGLYEDAQMALIALATVHKEYIKDIFQAWSDIKSKNINNDKESTIVTIINTKGDLIEKKYPPFKTTDADIDMLLLHEVESYAKNKNTNSCALNVYETAKKVVQDVKILACILISTVDTITMQDTPKISELEQALYLCAERVNSQLEIGNDISSLNLLLGNIHYQLVRCEIIDLRKRTEQEVSRMNVKPKKNILQGDEGDEMDKTSFAPAYSYLQLDAQSFIFENIDKAISFWENALANVENNFIVERTLSYIKALGYLYRLYAYKSKEIQIWDLLFKFSSQVSNIKYKVLAFAEILTIKNTISKASIENIKKEMENNGIDDKNYIKQLFNINLAKYLYYSGKVDPCLEILENLNDELIKCNHLVLFKKRFIHTIAKQAKEKSDNFCINVVNPIVMIFKQLLYLIKQGIWRSFSEVCIIQGLILDCSEYLGKVYTNANYVRETCCYTNYLLELAQRLALPLRVCKLLGILSHIDIKCNNNFECDLKLKAIETILDLKCIGDKENNENNCASPCLIDKINSEPHFLTSNNCSCTYCSNTDYQIISLNSVILRGLNLASNDSSQMAYVVFKVGYQIIKYLNSKKSKDIFEPLEPCKIDYYSALSTANVIWGRYDKALKYNLIAIEMCEKANFLHLFPKHILLCQKNNILWKQTNIIQKPVKVNPRKRFEERLELVKTPENQSIPISKEMRRTKIKNKEPITPRAFRPIKFEGMFTPYVKKEENHLTVPKFFKLQSEPKRTPLRLKESSVKKKNIKVFCDDDFATPLNTKSKIKPPSTRRKRCEPVSPTFKVPATETKLIFEDSSDDEIQFINRNVKSYSKKNNLGNTQEPQSSKNCLDLPTSRPTTPTTPTSNEASIIEGTPPKSARKLLLTPQMLSGEMSKLTLSTKASKKKNTDKPTEPITRSLRSRRLL